ncbi:group II intron maturase-specific domain-containing protein [Rhodoferax ferrireducens]|uniref:group II intron maturase-specific domain-containing protein n=1 Tax=Rhodoferax ferrireducens TaxID=192843 RepID=UPI000E0D48D9|nr:group II intron maturase-specific domain-containing protein [Rhodoferax ferrireducens]
MPAASWWTIWWLGLGLQPSADGARLLVLAFLACRNTAEDREESFANFAPRSSLCPYHRGWTAYFGISQCYRPAPKLDEWIRRRMCYWKQWRWARTKIKNLLALGVDLKSAIQHGVSSKSYWQMSRTPVINQAISNAWLKEQGLLSVKDLW